MMRYGQGSISVLPRARRQGPSPSPLCLYSCCTYTHTHTYTTGPEKHPYKAPAQCENSCLTYSTCTAISAHAGRFKMLTSCSVNLDCNSSCLTPGSNDKLNITRSTTSYSVCVCVCVCVRERESKRYSHCVSDVDVCCVYIPPAPPRTSVCVCAPYQ